MNQAIASTLISQDEALTLIESVIKQSQAEGVFVSFKASSSALSRFCENQISQNVNRDRTELQITSYYGQRSASSSTSQLTPEAISQTLHRSEELARFAPEDPEWVPLLEPQTYPNRFPFFDEHTANLAPLQRGAMVQKVCQLSRQGGVEGSGSLSTNVSLQAIGNSLGLRAGDRTTEADFSFTARIGNGSSWGHNTACTATGLPLEDLTKEVIERSKQSQNPREIKPGVYPVVFSGAAFATLLGWLMWNMDARSADEGRSFMSRNDEGGKAMGNCVGEQMFSPLVQVQRDPNHPLLQSGTFFDNGLSNNYLSIIQDGIPQTLSYNRYWAQQQSKEPTGSFYPIVMTGSSQSLADLVAQTEQGILVSRSWYVRYVNPRTLEVTGMTRDGTFWIEDGKIAYPIKNLRFNQELPQMLRDVEAASQAQRFNGIVAPGVKVKAFNFSSVTDSV